MLTGLFKLPMWQLDFISCLFYSSPINYTYHHCTRSLREPSLLWLKKVTCSLSLKFILNKKQWRVRFFTPNAKILGELRSWTLWNTCKFSKSLTSGCELFYEVKQTKRNDALSNWLNWFIGQSESSLYDNSFFLLTNITGVQWSWTEWLSES